MLIVFQREVHELSDPGSIHILHLVLRTSLQHGTLVEVLFSSEGKTPSLVDILTLIGAPPSPSPSPWPRLWWWLVLAWSSRVASVPVITSDLRLLVYCKWGSRLLLAATFSRRLDTKS